jgi:HPr kinase/phosphorylase
LSVPVGELLEALGERLALQLVAGDAGLAREIAAPRVQQPGLALAGYLPQLHPDRLQVLGNSEVGFLETLEPALARTRIQSIVESRVACFVVTNGTPVPPELAESAGTSGIAVLASGIRTAEFIRQVTAWLEERLAPEATMHADLVEVGGLGILILGRSGIGKSESALDLVSRGHRLVADDAVIVRRISPTVLRGRAATLLTHHMEIRGLGVIDVEALFGTLATLDERQVDLVVELIDWSDDADRLGLVDTTYTLLEVALPLVRIPVVPGRSMAMLIETAARDRLLRSRGRHSAADFAARIDRAASGERRGRGVG